jgi:hypothetical protein
MNTSLSPDNLKDDQFTLLQNVFSRYDSLSRRLGAYPVNQITAERIQLIAPYGDSSGAGFIRFGRTNIHRVTTTGVTAIPAAAGALANGTYDRFRTAFINGRFFFADNGADPIQEINFALNTFAQLGNAPAYKFLTSFNNRILAANLGGGVPKSNQVGWSGNLNFGEWNALVDPSAGFNVLVDTTSNTDDPISGLFGFDEVAIMLRQHSIWGIGKSPIATNPFVFYVLHPSIGCDCPYSAVAIKNGIAWYDKFTNGVYTLRVGETAPQLISFPIEKLLADGSDSAVTDEEMVEGSYDPLADEYTLLVTKKTTNVSTAYTYNFRMQNWVVNTYYYVNTIAAIKYTANNDIPIDSLVGTIDDLTGTIDALSFSGAQATKFFGQTNGYITREQNYPSDNGSQYYTYITSKLYRLERYKEYVSGFALEYAFLDVGEFYIQYSKDNGVTWNNWRTVTHNVFLDNGKRKRMVCRKHIQCTSFKWRILGYNARFELYNYEIYVIRSRAEQRKR